MGNSNFEQKNYDDELILIFDKFSVFQEGVLHNILIVTDRVYKLEASILKVLTPRGLVRWRL